MEEKMVEKKKITKLNLPDGRHFLVQEIDFKVIKEDFNEYQTSNGILVKQKTVIGKMFIEVNENSEIVRTPEGDPNVIVRSTNLIFSSD